VRSVLEGLPPARAEVAILTGGTATHLAWLAGRDGMIEHIDSHTVERVMAILSSQPASEIVSQYDVKPERAQVLPAGVRALQTLAQFYAVDRIVITRRGIREGTLIDYLQRVGKWPS
jgi:exopolyphosphatase/pppGpp-phosphohydrolase